jgi:hypothetical protein
VSGFTIAWLVWGAYFAVVEGYAIVRSHQQHAAGRHATGGTLSEHVWAWFGTAPGTHADTWAYVRRFVLLAFMAWLSVHFLTGGRYV